MNIRVLLADDHAIVRDGLRFMLEAQPDFQVVAAVSDGHEAVKAAQELKPNVAVLDISMPNLNGIEAAHQIKSKNEEIQIIILSIHAGEEYIYRAFQAGASGYLLKESAGIEVADAVRAVFTGRRYLSHSVADLVVDRFLDLRHEARSEDPLARLSAREREVLQLVAEGHTSAEIADLLALSVKSVDTYRSRIMSKLQVNDLPALVKFALRHGLIQLDD